LQQLIKTDQLMHLFDELSKLDIKVKSMRNESNRLEELFIEMVNSNEK